MIDDLIRQLRAGEWVGEQAADALEAQAKRIDDIKKRHEGCWQDWQKKREEKDARIAELEEALKRLHEAACDVDDSEMSFTMRDWWRKELIAARAALEKSNGNG